MQRAFRPEASRVQHWSFMRPAKHFYVYIMTTAKAPPFRKLRCRLPPRWGS